MRFTISRKLTVAAATSLIALVACLNVWTTFERPVHWTPDALFYQERLLEFRGVGHRAAVDRTFEAPLSAELRGRDPEHTGDPSWVAYNEPFYNRRVAVPLAGAAIYSLAGDRSLLYVSLVGYIAAVLAIFVLLLLRFRLLVATGVALATAFLPALVDHSSFPLTDSWGLALEVTAFIAAIVALDRGLRWLPLWIAAIVLLAFTRDSMWIPILAVGLCAWRLRSRNAAWLFGTGVAAALPALILYSTPVRSLLGLLVNNSDIPQDGSWSFIVRHYPGAAVELVRSDVGFLRDGAWYTGLYLVGGLALLLVFAVRSRHHMSPTTMLMTAGAGLGCLYVLAAPVYSAFRLELVLVPIAAYGLAMGADALLARARRRAQVGELAPVRVPAP